MCDGVVRAAVADWGLGRECLLAQSPVWPGGVLSALGDCHSLCRRRLVVRVAPARAPLNAVSDLKVPWCLCVSAALS